MIFLSFNKISSFYLSPVQVNTRVLIWERHCIISLYFCSESFRMLMSLAKQPAQYLFFYSFYVIFVDSFDLNIYKCKQKLISKIFQLNIYRFKSKLSLSINFTQFYDRLSIVFKWRLILNVLLYKKFPDKKNSTFSGHLPCEMRLNRADQTSEYVMLFISRYEFLN